MTTSPADFSHGDFARYFAPLALQSASQGLTYPLVAIVASRGPGGPLNLAGLAQSNMLLFLLGTLGFGLVATGMVFARSPEGYRRFRRVTFWIAAIVIVVQALLCLPWPSRFLFEELLGLPVSIAQPARLTLFTSIPLQLLFFVRIPYQVMMYNAGASGRASMATMLRIAVTAILSPLFSWAGLVGPNWAIFCLTLPVLLEVMASKALATPFKNRMEADPEVIPSQKTLFLFNLPLSISGYFLALSSMLLSAFIARALEPERMLPAYYLAVGLSTPVAFGATRVQELVLVFAPKGAPLKRILRFAVMAGVILGLLPLVFTLPGAAEWYYVGVQNLAAKDLTLVRWAALSLFFHPLVVAIRAQGEGIAASRRKPLVVIVGQAFFMGSVLVAAAASLFLGVPGNLIGAVAIVAGNLASTAVLRLLLYRMDIRAIPPL